MSQELGLGSAGMDLRNVSGGYGKEDTSMSSKLVVARVVIVG